MSSPVDIYNRLFAGERVAIPFASRKTYESLRVMLSRQHQTPKLLLELTDDSLCSSFDRATSIGTFWIGPARKTNNPVSYTIIGDSDAQI